MNKLLFIISILSIAILRQIIETTGRLKQSGFVNGTHTTDEGQILIAKNYRGLLVHN